MSTPSSKDLPTTLSNLTLTATPPSKKAKKPPVVENWEDAPSSDSEDERVNPDPPPPTPTTPLVATPMRNPSGVSSIAAPRDLAAAGGGAGGERPTTTDAVARRMISAALGVKNRSSKEQREYDAAVRAAEKKKRDDEREREREKEKEREKRRVAVWED